MPTAEFEERRIMALIPAAQAGDPDATHQICAYVFNRWRGRVKRYFHEDPALDRDDVISSFWEGIAKGVSVIDERGNPLYHLSQRGVWNVMSTIRAARRARFGTEEEFHVVPLGEGAFEEPDPAEDFREIIIRQDEAQRRLEILANCALSGTPRRLLDLMLEGRCDPSEKGFVRDAARDLGVSAQRVSQCMAQIRAEFGET